MDLEGTPKCIVKMLFLSSNDADTNKKPVPNWYMEATNLQYNNKLLEFGYGKIIHYIPKNNVILQYENELVQYTLKME